VFVQWYLCGQVLGKFLSRVFRAHLMLTTALLLVGQIADFHALTKQRLRETHAVRVKM